MENNWQKEIILDGNLVRLEPLQISHKKELIEAAKDGELWKLWYTSVPNEETTENFIKTALLNKEKGEQIPFVIIDKKSNKVIGTTRFMNMEPENFRLEIGHTWYAKSFQKTGVNTECKYLLLQYTFEKMNCIAVEFRTHWHNLASRNAILRLGAKQDGILRNHSISKNGVLRDTVVFSIINSEWKTVKFGLEHKMEKTY
ncbi:GNAT family N-acetyltransferase [Aureivirga marina]|uniref:GNAT family N-acetyltransferase n=1 Tax=Aureivirga marina TaxID=1182451 RepID=UPI0018CA2754|nr:GNAT family protein [Aureivirga marina]